MCAAETVAHGPDVVAELPRLPEVADLVPGSIAAELRVRGGSAGRLTEQTTAALAAELTRVRAVRSPVWFTSPTC